MIFKSVYFWVLLLTQVVRILCSYFDPGSCIVSYFPDDDSLFDFGKESINCYKKGIFAHGKENDRDDNYHPVYGDIDPVNIREDYGNLTEKFVPIFSETQPYGIKGSQKPEKVIAPAKDAIGSDRYEMYNPAANLYYYVPNLEQEIVSDYEVHVIGDEHTSKVFNSRLQRMVYIQNGTLSVVSAFFPIAGQPRSAASFVSKLSFPFIVLAKVDDLGFASEKSRLRSLVALNNWGPFEIFQPTASPYSFFEYRTNTTLTATWNTNETIRIDFIARIPRIYEDQTELPLIPGSIQCVFKVWSSGIPSDYKLSQIINLESLPAARFLFDIDETTSPEMIEVIRDKPTFGVSIGEFSEQHLGFSTRINLTRLPIDFLSQPKSGYQEDPSSYAFGDVEYPVRQKTSILATSDDGYTLSLFLYTDTVILNMEASTYSWDIDFSEIFTFLAWMVLLFAAIFIIVELTHNWSRYTEKTKNDFSKLRHFVEMIIEKVRKMCRHSKVYNATNTDENIEDVEDVEDAENDENDENDELIFEFRDER